MREMEILFVLKQGLMQPKVAGNSYVAENHLGSSSSCSLLTRAEVTGLSPVITALGVELRTLSVLSRPPPI